jgi:ubiquitin C-terminal hydrolase
LTEAYFTELGVSLGPYPISLEECLANMLKGESLSGDNQYYCATCGTKQDAVRSIVLSVLPKVLKPNSDN